jgi:hypothetical protein
LRVREKSGAGICTMPGRLAIAMSAAGWERAALQAQSVRALAIKLGKAERTTMLGSND